MTVIAITGGIGSGKSTVREIFEEHGARGIDADDLARKVVEPGSKGARLLLEEFGPSFFNHEGILDRKKMAAHVFNDSESLASLEAILHPLIRAEEARRVGRILQDWPGAVVVIEIPLLAEGGRSEIYDGVLLVTAPEPVRLDRLVKAGKYSREEAVARMKSQAPDEERARLATWTVDNGGSREETAAQVLKILGEISG